MTPRVAAHWLRRFAHWRQCELSPLARYEADMCGAHIVLGKWSKVLQMARDRRFDRRLRIFVRRLVRLVDGFKLPACGWCCDTGMVAKHRGPLSYCDCAAGAALIAERYRPLSLRDRQNLAGARKLRSSAQRSERWHRRS
jgi:hypothetical protein